MFPLDWQLNTIVDGEFTVEEDRDVVAKLGEVAVDEKIRSLRDLHVVGACWNKQRVCLVSKLGVAGM